MLPKKRSVKAPTKGVAIKAAVVVPIKPTRRSPRAAEKAIAAPVKAKKVRKVLPKTAAAIVKKNTLGKTESKKVVLKKITAKKAEPTTTPEVVVMIEGTISKRLLEKKRAYELWLRDHASSQFSSVASVFGYFFIVSGLLSAVFIMAPDWSGFTNQTAALPCTEKGQCEISTSTSVLPKVTYVTAPEIIPGKDLVVTIEINNLDLPTLVVASPLLTPPLRLNPTSHDNNVYTYNVPTSTLPPSEYRLRVEGVASLNVTTSFVGPLISLEEVATTTEALATSSSSTTTVAAETKVDWEVEPHQLAIAKSASGGANQVTFLTMNKFEEVEFYIRPDHGINEFLLGLAELQTDVWVYNFDRNKLPYGTYTILAKGIDQGEIKAEAMISFSNIPTDEMLLGEETTTEVLSEVINEETATNLLKTLSIENHAGTTSGLEQEVPEESDVEELTASTSVSVGNLPESINTILSVFASAKQSNHELLLRVSEVALEEAVAELVTTFAARDTEPAETATFETNLRSELKKEKALIALNSQNSNAFYPADTDQDGITDAEENASGRMSATMADTDNDGYLDGIEHIFGYDPADFSPETVFRLRTNLNNIPQTETVLGIESISPLALYRANELEPLIHLQVTGFGIPNSYVVLTVETSEVAVLVPIDEKGVFTHTIETDLADGVYTASVYYVANSGAYVAASRPFTFTKDARETNYIKTAGTAPVLGASFIETDPKVPYLPGSLGVIAFGLSLLYISRSLRYGSLSTEKTRSIGA